MDDLRRLFSDPSLNLPLFKPAEERAMLQLIHLDCDGDRHVLDHTGPARDEFIRRNMKLVLACARRFIGALRQNRNERLLELVSAGTEGLMRGIDRFNVEATDGIGHHYRFSTYGMWWISSLIREELGQYDKRVVRHKSYHDQFKQARWELCDLLGAAEVLDETVYFYLQLDKGWSAEKLRRFIDDRDHRIVPVESVAEPLHDADDALSSLIRREHVAEVGSLLETLPYNQVFLLLQHYYADEAHDDIADTLGVSRERVRQMENEALRKLWIEIDRRQNGRHQ